MWTNIDDTAMESSILRDLADFDISSPIKVELCFETDSDVTSDILIKKENDTDSHIVEYNDEANFVSVRDYKSEKEIKEEPLELRGATEQINNKDDTARILQEITTHQAEEIQNKLCNNDNSRKRKQQQLQIYKNKKAANMTEQKKIDDRTEKKDENGAQDKVSASTSIESSNLFYKQSSDTTPQNQQHLRTTVLPNPSILPSQPDVHVQAKDKANGQMHLLNLADNMQHIMEAYCFQKQYNSCKENFKRLKDRYFNLSYDTVVKMILPMEQNKDFIHLFLKETHRRAAEKSYYKCGYQDYRILLAELMTWTRNMGEFMKQKFKSSCQPAEINENVKVNREINERQLENNNKNDNLNKSPEANGLCIFSSGSPGCEISINIDPNINRYIMSSIVRETNKDVRNIEPPPVSKESQKQNPCNTVMTARTNNKNQINKKQPAPSSSANMLRMDSQLPCSPEPNRDQSSLMELLTSIEIPTQQIHPRLPQEMQSVQSQHELQQSLYHSANVPVQYGQSPSLTPKYGQITNLQLQHGQSQSVQQQYRQSEVAIPLHEQLLNNHLQVKAQYGKQQYMQPQHKSSVHHMPQYSQSQNRQQQVVQSSPPSLHQNVQSQPVLPHYEQVQQQRSQTHKPKYHQYHNILVQPQAQSNHMFPHGGQTWTVPSPYPHYVVQHHKQPSNSQMQVGFTKQVHPCYEQPRHAMPQNQQSKHASSQAGQLQQQNNQLKELLDKPQHLDWPHELSAIYSQPNMQQQIQKNTTRSASTDSGFISPLNFNVSADQTVTPLPPPPETETSPLLITHVTSLNPKVSFIDEGECVICKKRTKQMCMGCMKYYYCSYDCQVQDWRTHQSNCKADPIRSKYLTKSM